MAKQKSREELERELEFLKMRRLVDDIGTKLKFFS